MGGTLAERERRQKEEEEGRKERAIYGRNTSEKREKTEERIGRKEREGGTHQYSRIYGRDTSGKKKSRRKEEEEGRKESAELSRTPGFMGGTRA